jgi:hypothetical protein
VAAKLAAAPSAAVVIGVDADAANKGDPKPLFLLRTPMVPGTQEEKDENGWILDCREQPKARQKRSTLS